MSAPEFRAALLSEYPAVRRYALKLTRNPDDADDLAQLVMMHALEGAASYEPARGLQPWLISICRRKFISEHLRRAWRRAELSDPDGALSARCAADCPDPDAALDARAALRLADQLAPRDRGILFEIASGEGYARVASRFAVSLTQVKNRAYRGAAKFAAILLASGHIVPGRGWRCV